MVKFKDYYDTLGVSRSATDKEIKSAYRKLARQHHPDANPGDKAAEDKFKDIAEAYEVLKDPEKRRRYDMLGSGWKAGADFQPPPDFGGFNFDFGDLGDLGKGSPFSDFFEMVFGQTLRQAAGRGGQAPPRGAPGRAGQDQEAEIELSVEELARGTTRMIQVSAPGMRSKTLEVKIPAGVRGGSRVRVPGEGAPSALGGARGDLYLKVKVKPHPYYSLDGDSLISEAQISPAQAVLGGEVTVTTIDGLVRITVPAGTQPGRLLRLRGKGLPKIKRQERGDHLVRIKIVVPTQLSAEEKALYEKLALIEHDRLRATSGT